MKINQDSLGFYYTDFPHGYRKVISWSEFYMLKPKQRKFIEGNIELVVGGEYLIYSFFSIRYYMRRIHEHLNIRWYDKLIKEGQMYIKYTKEQQEIIKSAYEKTDITYNAFVKLNELTYELDSVNKYRPDLMSVKNKLEEQIAWLNRQKKRVSS